jgi:hypothetical protein
MNINNFLDKENITTLWDVISDESIFKFLHRDVQERVFQIFSNNIKDFFNIERTKNNDLIDLNKKYIMVLLNYIKKNYPHQTPNKIKIFDESPPNKESITYEEIQNNKKSQFDKDLQKRQQDFEDSISIKAPPVPDFSDKFEDKPISEMDRIIKEMTAKRNYDVEQINKNYNTDINQTNNWLKPTDTSIKNEKLTKIKNPEESFQTYNKIKYIDNGTNNFTEKKTVTWADNREIQLNLYETLYEKETPLEPDIVPDDIETNIFKKLKKIDNPYESEKSEKSEKYTNYLLENNILLEEKNPDNKFENNYKNKFENEINILESEIKNLNKKIDIILMKLKT